VAEVRVAVPLDATRRGRLEKALARATDLEVELKVLVDPAVIGGVVARVGDQVFDGTIRRRLDLARERLGQIR
jgi:F-type H+-transporting ATPase subunit delta